MILVKVNLDGIAARRLAPLVTAISKVLPASKVDIDEDGWMVFTDVSISTQGSPTSSSQEPPSRP